METNGITSLVPNIQLFADGGGTPAAPAAPATGPAPINPTDPNPAPAKPAEPAAQPFKSFASQSEFDQFVQQTLKSREESLKAKLTPEIKAQLDKESKMTAEQKVQAQLDQLEADKKALAKEKNRIKAESLLVKGGITDEVSRATMLDSVVGEDETESLKRTQALVDAIDKATNEKIKAAMKKVTPPDGGTGGQVKQAKETMGKILGHQYAEARKGASKAMDYYKVGGNKS